MYNKIFNDFLVILQYFNIKIPKDKGNKPIKLIL